MNLKSEGRIGTAISYRTTINSINQFKPKMLLQDVTKNFLFAYENHMIDLKKSLSTVGIYLRQLRAVVNKAIDANVLKQENAIQAYRCQTAKSIILLGSQLPLQWNELHRYFAFKA